MTNEERFWSKVNKTEACWLWIGGIFENGYGIFHLNRKPYGAHRYAWQIYYNVHPGKLYVLHKCRNKNCVRREHLYLGTPRQNSLDKIRDGTNFNGNYYKTHCINGHEFTYKNTYIRKEGGRKCKKCRAINSLKKYYSEKSLLIENL